MNSIVNAIKSPSANVVGGVVVGMALFGLLIWAVRKVPSNAVTAPIKKAADVVTAG